MWLKRQFSDVGLTQYPPGPHLDAISAKFGGHVVFCLDVSGSMSLGSRLPTAVAGVKAFMAEAIENGYEVALILWHHAIENHTGLSRTAGESHALLDRAVPSGGNNIVPALDLCEVLLKPFTGDRVIAIFGDGDLGDPATAKARARPLVEQNIRIITCGLGESSAETLAGISTEELDTARSASEATLTEDVRQMASGLRLRM